MMKKSQSDLENNLNHHHNGFVTAAASSSSSVTSLIAPVTMFNTSAHPKPPPTSGLQGINVAVETAAKKYRCSAQNNEATCCWKGKLPPKQYKTPIVYSTKVFVGGLPWDIQEDGAFFSHFFYKNICFTLAYLNITTRNLS
jgi:hypothetical protein